MCPRTGFAAGGLALVLLAAAAAQAGGEAQADGGIAAAAAGTTSRLVLTATHASGIPVAEISGLAWDADEQVLHAVSDQGYVYRFQVERDGDTLVAVTPVAAAALSDPAGGAATGGSFNAEALDVRNATDGVRGNSELLVALEAKPPRIACFGTGGALRGTLPVPPPANDANRYEKKGRGLESVTIHPGLGLITAPEAPLRTTPAGLHTIYAEGHAWSFPRRVADSRLKGIEVLPDGSLVVLERSRNGSKSSMVASLRRVDVASCDAHGVCPTATLAVLPAGPENFEGMTLLDPHHVLLASDNGGDERHAATFALVVLP